MKVSCTFFKQDAYHSWWMKTVDARLRQLGFTTKDFFLLSKAKTLLLVQHQFAQMDYSSMHFTSCILPPQTPILCTRHLMALHLVRAFTLARLNAIRSEVLQGRFHHIPYSDCLCRCGYSKTDTVSLHFGMLFFFYQF